MFTDTGIGSLFIEIMPWSGRKEFFLYEVYERTLYVWVGPFQIVYDWPGTRMPEAARRERLLEAFREFHARHVAPPIGDYADTDLPAAA